MNRGRFRIISSMLGAIGLLAAPAVVPSGGSESVAQQQSQRTKDQGITVAAQVPQARVAVDARSFLGGTMRHPVWVGRAKFGKGRKSGNRSRWDYRR